MVLVPGAQHIPGPFGEDSDLRRWGLKLAEHEGKNGKKYAIVAGACKLAVLPHHLWIHTKQTRLQVNNIEQTSIYVAAYFLRWYAIGICGGGVA